MGMYYDEPAFTYAPTSLVKLKWHIIVRGKVNKCFLYERLNKIKSQNRSVSLWKRLPNWSQGASVSLSLSFIDTVSHCFPEENSGDTVNWTNVTHQINSTLNFSKLEQILQFIHFFQRVNKTFVLKYWISFSIQIKLCISKSQKAHFWST